MRQVVTGSIATDHLMVFPGHFTEQLVEGKLDKVSLSFLVDELEIHRGGIAANVAFGLARLGLRPILVGSVGADFADYRQWLEAHDVDTRHVRVSEPPAHRPVPVHDRRRQQPDRVLLRRSDERGAADRPGRDPALGTRRGPRPDLPRRPGSDAAAHPGLPRLAVPFAADPSQQIARMEGTDLRRLVDGARYLFTNEYERALLIRKTGWDAAQLLGRVGAWVTTTGPDGVTVESAAEPPVSVAAAALSRIADPTGAGDAFRAGFLAGIGRGLGHEGAAQLGCAMAALVMETSGTQEYRFQREEFLARIGESYGARVAATMAAGMGPLASSRAKEKV